MEGHVLVPREMIETKDRQEQDSDEEDQSKFGLAARQLAAKFRETAARFIARHKPVGKTLSGSQSANGPERVSPEEGLTVASETYSRYDYKRLGFEGEFYHFDFMVIVHIF